MFGIQRAIILAAGKGTRLKSLTQDKPKALMQIGGEPAIVRVIRHLVRQGIHDIAINIHHHASQIQNELGNGAHFNANLYYSYEEQLLDSGGGARTALNLLPGEGSVLIHNADIMSTINITHLYDICPTQGCALALVPNPKHNLQGDFSLQQQRIIQQPQNPYTFAGVSVWQPSALLEYPNQRSFSLVQPIHACIAQQQCTSLIHQGHWFDVGRPHDLIQAHRYYSQEAL